MRLKKLLSTVMLTFLTTILITGCGIPPGEIDVVSREDGSGTRGAFTELFDIVDEGEGYRYDRTTKNAIISNSTDVVLSQVAQDENAIGYVSISALNDSVKPIAIDGVEPTVENVNSGEYKIVRNFVIATKPELSEVAQDFIDYILSAEGQAVVAKSFIPISTSSAPYSGLKPSGIVKVNGSSSVSPIMEKLKEGYEVVNPNATVEIQASDSTTGMTAAIEGNCDIGMSSRDLTEKELAVLTPTPIAIDGIAVIVNPANPVTNLTKEQVQKIYMGEITNWDTISAE